MRERDPQPQSSGSSQPGGAGELKPKSSAPKRILVVDDEAHIVQVLSLKLRNAGYEVLTARDGEEGFEVASQQRPDLIIADFQMPYMTGLELCRALAVQQGTAEIPVIILTARGYALDDEDLKLGTIRTVLSKPFSPRGILQEVKDVLDSTAARSPSAFDLNSGSGPGAKRSQGTSGSSARPGPSATSSGPNGGSKDQRDSKAPQRGANSDPKLGPKFNRGEAA